MPSLVESIKELGLVLVTDTSDETADSPPAVGTGAGAGAGVDTTMGMGMGATIGMGESLYRMPGGVNGIMRGTGVLRFNDTIDM